MGQARGPGIFFGEKKLPLRQTGQSGYGRAAGGLQEITPGVRQATLQEMPGASLAESLRAEAKLNVAGTL